MSNTKKLLSILAIFAVVMIAVIGFVTIEEQQNFKVENISANITVQN